MLTFNYFLAVQMPPGSSSMKMQYPSGPAGRGRFGTRISSGGLTNEPAEGGSNHPLVGKKVWTRWPEDNSFYEAVIFDYNPVDVYPTSCTRGPALLILVLKLLLFYFPGSTSSCL